MILSGRADVVGVKKEDWQLVHIVEIIVVFYCCIKSKIKGSFTSFPDETYRWVWRMLESHTYSNISEHMKRVNIALLVVGSIGKNVTLYYRNKQRTLWTECGVIDGFSSMYPYWRVGKVRGLPMESVFYRIAWGSVQHTYSYHISENIWKVRSKQSKVRVLFFSVTLR
jgi:hypothetical protein